MRLALQQRLEEGAVVRIAAGRNYSTTGRVLYSLPHHGLHYATVGVQEDERRRETRIKVAEAAHLSSLQAHAAIDCRAAVANVSRSGIGLTTDVRIERDLVLKVVLYSAIVFGEVRHCTPTAADPRLFHVGLEIQTVIFRNVSHCAWLIAPRVLWATLSLGFQLLTQRFLGRRPL